MQIPKLLIHPLVEKFYEIRGRNHLVAGSHRRTHCGKRRRLCHIRYRQRTGYRQSNHGTNPESFKNTNPVGSVSKSYGLANLYKRIKLYFEKSSELTIESEPENHRTTVTMRIHTINS